MITTIQQLTIEQVNVPTSALLAGNLAAKAGQLVKEIAALAAASENVGGSSYDRPVGDLADAIRNAQYVVGNLSRAKELFERETR